MRVEGGVGEALPVVLAEELAVAQADVVDLVPGAPAVRPLPLLGRHLPLPENSHERTVTDPITDSQPNLGNSVGCYGYVTLNITLVDVT